MTAVVWRTMVLIRNFVYSGDKNVSGTMILKALGSDKEITLALSTGSNEVMKCQLLTQ